MTQTPIDVGIYHITIPHEHGWTSYVKLPGSIQALTSWGKTKEICQTKTIADLARFDYRPIFKEQPK